MSAVPNFSGEELQAFPDSSEHLPPKPRSVDAGIGCLVLIARHHGLLADEEQIRHSAGRGEEALGAEDLELIGRRLGLKTRRVKVNAERLSKTPCPALAIAPDGRHFIVVGADGERAMTLHPYDSAPKVTSPEEAIAPCGGDLLLFASRASAASELARFDFSWFVPAVVKYRRLLAEVLLVSLVLQLFGLVTPLMTQVVLDKVLVNRAFGTLNVVCAALATCMLFEALLTGLRNYVFSHTANRIDVELGARLFRHLVALPLQYFASRRVGDTVTRVRELENIRTFLTSQALTALIDMFFSVVFFAVMFMYSTALALVVLASLPLYAMVSMVLNPTLRRRLHAKFARGADNHSFLVESVSAAETLKALAVEPQFVRRWDMQLAAYVSAGFKVNTVSNVGQQLIQLVGRGVTLVLLYLGAHLVIDGRMSIGQLIAFNMMSQHVATPVLRLAQLWQDFQQVGISMQRLGDILNARTEQPASQQTLPAMRGNIMFDNVRFKYRADGAPVLDGVSLEIPAGQVIGVVGRSGSGKSTLTKLVQRLYLPESGRIQVDGVDLLLADPAWLRRHIGVVLQENVLFNRSIRENIAISDPGSPLPAIIHAAKLAGAHEFISEMPEGYDTIVGEHGSSLSGGQRQRVAIARALLCNPRILIFDEATSALDFETEHVIRRNMRAICEGRTVIIIAHRLSAVRGANHIIVMDKGRIVERGTHDQLISQRGAYAHLASFQHT